MVDAVLFIFAVNLSLLFVHEMDAIRRMEWRMFIGLNRMDEEKAYRIFTMAHVPLYVVLILFLLDGFKHYEGLTYLVTDGLLIAHSVVHILFKRHKGNGFANMFSNVLIHSMGILGIIHLLLIGGLS